jgi:hypothetical protein
MFFVFEISKPFQKKPGFYHSEITIFRVWWLWFALSLHPVRYDEMINLSASGVVVWENSHLTSRAIDSTTRVIDIEG